MSKGTVTAKANNAYLIGKGEYNSLFDVHLIGHFEKPHFRRQLMNAKLINK